MTGQTRIPLETGGPPQAPSETPENAEPAASLDQILDQLEAMLQRLADPAAPLDQAVSDYRRAARLLASAEARLEVAARRVADLQPRRG